MIAPPEKGPEAPVTFPSLDSGSWSSLQLQEGYQGGTKKVDCDCGSPSTLIHAVPPWASTLASLGFCSLICIHNNILGFVDPTQEKVL